MSKKSVTFVVDDRENEDVVASVASHDEVEDWYIDRLEVGDIQCEEADVIFERKTMNDYAGSIKDGHLNSQVERMKDACDNTFILVEDDLQDSNYLSNTRMKPESIRGSMASIMARDSTPVIPCSNIDLLVDMAVRISRKFVEDPSSSVLKTAGFNEAPTVKKMYGCLPGIGPERADDLYEEYPQVGMLLAASTEQIAEIDGVGETTAEKIKEEFHDG